MKNGLYSSFISNARIKKTISYNEKNSSLNHTTSITNLINANQRFNKKQESLNISNPKQINSLKYTIPKWDTIRRIKKIQMNDKKNKVNEGNQSETKYRKDKEYFLPILSKDNRRLKRYNYNNNKNLKIKILKKLILNKNKKQELVINPISLNFETSSKIIRHKRKSKIKDNFLKRVKDYKKRLKEELFDYKYKNFSVNSSQNVFLDKQKYNNFIDTNIYIDRKNKNNYKDLSKYYGKMRRSRVAGLKSFINNSQFNMKKNLLNDEMKGDFFNTINIK